MDEYLSELTEATTNFYPSSLIAINSSVKKHWNRRSPIFKNIRCLHPIDPFEESLREDLTVHEKVSF